MTRKQRRLVMISSGARRRRPRGWPGAVRVARQYRVLLRAERTCAKSRREPARGCALGGLVKQGSLEREGGRRVRFTVTDMKQDVAVTYVGLLPDLFREGQGVVAEGTIGADHVFRADNVLAKHDERYMPREVADALKKQGVWREGADVRAGGRKRRPRWRKGRDVR